MEGLGPNNEWFYKPELMNFWHWLVRLDLHQNNGSISNRVLKVQRSAKKRDNSILKSKVLGKSTRHAANYVAVEQVSSSVGPGNFATALTLPQQKGYTLRRHEYAFSYACSHIACTNECPWKARILLPCNYCRKCIGIDDGTWSASMNAKNALLRV